MANADLYSVMIYDYVRKCNYFRDYIYKKIRKKCNRHNRNNVNVIIINLYIQLFTNLCFVYSKNL